MERRHVSQGSHKISLLFFSKLRHKAERNRPNPKLYIFFWNHYAKITGTERGYIVGDLNGDGQVNIVDLFVVAKNFGHKEEDYDQ